MEKTYSVKETAKLLGYSTNSVYGFLDKGLIKSVRIGNGKFKIPQSEIDKFMIGRGSEVETISPKKEMLSMKAYEDEKVGLDSNARNEIINDGLGAEVTFKNAVAAEKPEREAEQEMLVKTVIVPSEVLPTPRPGKSLADLSGERPLYFMKLWFEERVGLPRLFDWFISLSSIILGISMYLHTKQVDLLVVGRFSMWFGPIRIALIAGGFGLILADMIQEEYLRFRNMSSYFRFLLFLTYAILSIILLTGNDIDGFLIHGLFAIAILMEAVMDVRSSTAYMLYIQGLLIGTALIFVIFPTDAGLSTITTVLFAILDGYRWVWLMVVTSFVLVTLFGFFWEKNVLKISSSICGSLLVLLAIYYANNNYWSRAFFVMISGMIGVILPFWDKFKEKFETDRPLVFRMFGTVLMSFSLVVVLIGIVQSILLTDANVNLAEKADYGKIISERTVDNVFSTLEGVATNPVFVTAVIKNDVVTIDGFAKSIFKNNSDLGEVITINKMGKPVSSYPFSVEIMNSYYTNELFLKNTLGGLKYFSRTIESVPGVSKNAIVIAVPISNATTKEEVGILVAPIDVASLGDRLSEIAFADQRITLIDGNGRWIVNSDPKLLGELIPEADTTSLVWNKDGGSEIGYDNNGKYSLFRSNKSNVIGWTVVATQPVFSILDVSRSGLVLILILLLITTLVVSFSFVFAKTKMEAQ